MSTVSPAFPRLVGGALCLDFANTVDPRHSDERDDYLPSYAALVDWSEYANLLSARQARELTQRARTHPAAADAVHRRALALRDVVYHAFTARPRQARSTVVATLNDEVHRALAMADLAADETGWTWRWRPGPIADRMLWPVARSAADLLVSGQLDRVRECDAPSGCGWLFLDTSKNGRRRWCDMTVCGNRAKARRRREQRSNG